jgi:hypothetical protein
MSSQISNLKKDNSKLRGKLFASQKESNQELKDKKAIILRLETEKNCLQQVIDGYLRTKQQLE